MSLLYLEARYGTLLSLVLMVGVSPAFAQSDNACNNISPHEITVEMYDPGLEGIHLYIYDASGNLEAPFLLEHVSGGCDWHGELDDQTSGVVDWTASDGSILFIFEFSRLAIEEGREVRDVIARYAFLGLNQALGGSYKNDFYVPLPYVGDTPDVGFGIYLEDGAPVVRAFPIGPREDSAESYESAFGSSRYVLPFETRPGLPRLSHFLAPLDPSGPLPDLDAAPSYTFSGYADVVIESSQSFEWDVPNLTLAFPGDTRLVVKGDLAADGVTFTDADGQGGRRWGGVAVYAGGSLDFDGVTVSGAAVGVDVYATDVSVTGGALTGNSTGLRSSYVQNYCPGLEVCLIGNQSSFVLEDVSVVDNAGIGILARHAEDISITDTEIKGNAGDGLFLWGAEVVDFRRNYVEDNGGAGISVADNADLSFTNVTDGYPDGLVRVANNGGDEVYVGEGGYFFAGQTALGGGQNAIFDDSPAANTYLVYNDTKAQVSAEETFWGLPSGPPAGSLVGWINANDPLPCDPTTPDPCSLRPTGPLALPAERGSGDWLREAIRSTRETLRYYSDTESAHLLAHALYAFQRLDADDTLGERAATMALLRSLRGRLAQGSLSAFLRRTAEAALVVEVREALRVENYESAEGLLAAYAPLTEGAEARRSLTLSAAALDEQAGRPEEALARIEGVLAELGPEENRLAEVLEVVAGILVESAGAEGRPGGSGHVGGALGEAAAASVEGSVLSAPYPNPSHGMATAPLRLPEATDVQVRVYDVLGREVAMLAEGRLEAGTHRFVLDAALSAGVYVIRAELDGARVLTQRLTVIR